MTLSKAEIRDKIEEGAIKCLITLEVAGKPKEHVEKALEELLGKLKEEKHLDILKIVKGEAKELEDDEGYFSAFAEIGMLVPDMESLTFIAMNFTPASIEILAPDRFVFPPNRVQNWLNDLLSKLHSISQEHRNLTQQTRYYQQNMNRLARNIITVLLAAGHQTSDTLSKLTGIEEENVKKILEHLKKEEQVMEKDGKWVLKQEKK